MKNNHHSRTLFMKNDWKRNLLRSMIFKHSSIRRKVRSSSLRHSANRLKRENISWLRKRKSLSRNNKVRTKVLNSSRSKLNKLCKWRSMTLKHSFNQSLLSLILSNNQHRINTKITKMIGQSLWLKTSKFQSRANFQKHLVCCSSFLKTLMTATSNNLNTLTIYKLSLRRNAN